SLRRAVGAYLALGLLTLLVLAFTTRFHQIDLSVPMIYDADSELYLMLITGLIRNEWLPFTVPHSAHLGAPFGFNMYDFPGAADSNFMFLMIKCITLFTHELGRVFNYYALLTYFLVALTSLFALRHYRISYSVAIVVSLLFAFLSYHFFRLT